MVTWPAVVRYNNVHALSAYLVNLSNLVSIGLRKKKPNPPTHGSLSLFRMFCYVLSIKIFVTPACLSRLASRVWCDGN